MDQTILRAYDVLTSRDRCSHLPDQPDWVKGRVIGALERGELLTMVGFWGVGERGAANGVDTQALDNLASLVGQLAIPVRLSLILAGEHGRLNGKNSQYADDYLAGITKLAKERNFEWIYQSTLWERWGLREPFGTITDIQWDQNPLASTLEARSRKHYRGEMDPRQDAQRYYLMCRAERQLLSREFPLAIWWSYSSPVFREILPDLPRVYLWSIRKGTSAPPWFM